MKFELIFTSSKAASQGENKTKKKPSVLLPSHTQTFCFSVFQVVRFRKLLIDTKLMGGNYYAAGQAPQVWNEKISYFKLYSLQNARTSICLCKLLIAWSFTPHVWINDLLLYFLTDLRVMNRELHSSSRSWIFPFIYYSNLCIFPWYPFAISV